VSGARPSKDRKPATAKRAARPGPAAAAKQGEVRTRRERRSTSEIRKAILGAARELFVARGYAGTSTRTIADKAGVQEPLLFRNFGNKAGLFEASVFESFDDYVHAYWQRFVGEALPASFAEQTEDYVKTLYHLLMENRELVVAMFAAHHASDGGSMPRPLDKLFRILEEVAGRQYRAEGWSGIDVEYAVRFTFGLVLATVVFQDWIMPSGAKSVRQADMADALVGYVLNGVLHRVRDRGAAPVRRKKN
jgi:AcrR family transcriptional regulator